MSDFSRMSSVWCDLPQWIDWEAIYDGDFGRNVRGGEQTRRRPVDREPPRLNGHAVSGEYRGAPAGCRAGWLVREEKNDAGDAMVHHVASGNATRRAGYTLARR
jgi:hypothetical protein